MRLNDGADEIYWTLVTSSDNSVIIGSLVAVAGIEVSNETADGKGVGMFDTSWNWSSTPVGIWVGCSKSAKSRDMMILSHLETKKGIRNCRDRRED